MPFPSFDFIRTAQPLSECSFAIESIIEDLQHDPWPTPSDQRVARCGGAALSVAIGLLESSFARQVRARANLDPSATARFERAALIAMGACRVRES